MVPGGLDTVLRWLAQATVSEAASEQCETAAVGPL
jgi:hypothetical protein